MNMTGLLCMSVYGIGVAHSKLGLIMICRLCRLCRLCIIVPPHEITLSHGMNVIIPFLVLDASSGCLNVQVVYEA